MVSVLLIMSGQRTWAGQSIGPVSFFAFSLTQCLTHSTFLTPSLAYPPSCPSTLQPYSNSRPLDDTESLVSFSCTLFLTERMQDDDDEQPMRRWSVMMSGQMRVVFFCRELRVVKVKRERGGDIGLSSPLLRTNNGRRPFSYLLLVKDVGSWRTAVTMGLRDPGLHSNHITKNQLTEGRARGQDEVRVLVRRFRTMVRRTVCRFPGEAGRCS